VTNVLIDIILVGIVAFAARKRMGGRRVVNPAAPAERTTFVLREPPKAASVEAPICAAATNRTETSVALPAYIVSGRRTGGSGDRMAETLAMMSGPGICTPRQR